MPFNNYTVVSREKGAAYFQQKNTSFQQETPPSRFCTFVQRRKPGTHVSLFYSGKTRLKRLVADFTSGLLRSASIQFNLGVALHTNHYILCIPSYTPPPFRGSHTITHKLMRPACLRDPVAEHKRRVSRPHGGPPTLRVETLFPPQSIRVARQPNGPRGGVLIAAGTGTERARGGVRAGK